MTGRGSWGINIIETSTEEDAVLEHTKLLVSFDSHKLFKMNDLPYPEQASSDS
jgi:hypothetical protein